MFMILMLNFSYIQQKKKMVSNQELYEEYRSVKEKIDFFKKREKELYSQLVALNKRSVGDAVFYTASLDGSIIPCMIKEVRILSYVLRVVRNKNTEKFFVGTNTFSNNKVITASPRDIRDTSSTFTENDQFTIVPFKLENIEF